MSFDNALILGETVPPRFRAAMTWPASQRKNAGEFALFRRKFDLADVPESLRVFVTADSRYILYVNGERVGRGPLKGTLRHYHAEEYEIAPLLKMGENVIAASVVWFGYNTPLSEEHSGFPGFLLQGPESLPLDTPGEWRAFACDALEWDRTPYTCNAHLFMGGLEKFDAKLFPNNWQVPAFDDSAWPAAPLAFPLTAVGGNPEANLVWNFVPRDLPALIEEPRRFAQPASLTLAPGEGGEIVLDAGVLTTGYPTFDFVGGEGRTVEIIYSECVWQRTEKPDDGRPYLWGGGGRLTKGVRDDLTNGILHGYQDTVMLAGGEFTYEPFHFRTFWYIKIKVSAGETDFALRDASYRFTTHPQTLKAAFTSSEPDIAKIMEVSWRTLQLCSHETYEDCPRL